MTPRVHHTPKYLDRHRFDNAFPFKIDGVYCKLIPLTKGQYTIVWESDYVWLMKWKWYAHKSPHVKLFYAVRGADVGGKRRIIPMHRQLLGLAHGDPRKGDHISTRETLDNRGSNLRIASNSESQCNRGIQNNNTSGFKGVSWHSQRNRWRATIKINRVNIYLGLFDTREEAYSAYCYAANKLHGRFANLG
jgi:hypothetical protein